MSRRLPLELPKVDASAFTEWDAPASAKFAVLLEFAHRNHAAALARVEALGDELLEATDVLDYWAETFFRLAAQVADHRRLERLYGLEEFRRSKVLEDTVA